MTERTPIACTAAVRRIGDRLIAALPAEASAALPSRGQVAVTGTADGDRFGTVVEPDGRRGHWLRVEDLPQPHPADGHAVTLELTPTAAWPDPEVPGDLASALAAAPDAADVWTDITPMARWEWVRWIGATRSAATRARRVEATISKMRSGKRRPCCFDLSSCTDPEVARSGALIEAHGAR